jgi:hypothetical protein
MIFRARLSRVADRLGEKAKFRRARFVRDIEFSFLEFVKKPQKDRLVFLIRSGPVDFVFRRFVARPQRHQPIG